MSRKLVEKMVRDLVANEFANGWFGDKSEEFIQSEIDTYINHYESNSVIAHVQSNIINLKMYCGWSYSEVNELGNSFGIYLYGCPKHPSRKEWLVPGREGEYKCRTCKKPFVELELELITNRQKTK